MKIRVLAVLIATTLVVLGVTSVYFESRGAARSIDEITAQEKQLVVGKCGKEELVDRWLLQQSWFHDPSFTELAGAFGQSSFSLYPNGASPEGRVEGAFCINGRDLVVRYFENRSVPVSFSLRKLSIEFGSKLKPLGEDNFTIRELTKQKMVVAFASDGRDHVFYRRN